MKRNLWTRLLAVCLALCCFAGMVSAANLLWDLNSDQVTDVWDLQLAVNQKLSSADSAAVLEEALGGSDQLHPNAEGVYEISTALGLYNMGNIDTEGVTFRLVSDLDMGDAIWTPVAGFKGIFDGNGKTIRNLVIKGSAENVGLFADVQAGALVKDLAMEDVTVGASGQAKYVGVVAGTNAGTISNVNVIATIADNREASETVYYGALAGKCEATGVIAAGTGISVSDGANKYTTTGLCADLKVLTSNTNPQKGVAAFAETGATVSGIFCDSSYSTTLLSEAEQTRRETVVDNMYQQGTVKWTTTETLYYTKNDVSDNIHSNAYLPGRTYTGIPYNHGAGSLERFLSQMQAGTDSQGRLVTVAGLEHATYENTSSVTTNNGFAQYMGTDCSSAIGWAWAAVSSGRTESNSPGVFLHTCRFMVPNTYNTSKYGVLAAGGYQLPASTAEMSVDGRNTRDIITLNGTQAMAEAYAKSHRGDALVYNITNDEDFSNEAGHARLIAEDPVVIRSTDGTIDLEKSYVITHEQGDGLGDKKDQDGNYISKYDTTSRRDSTTGIFADTYNIKYTSWRINHKYSFSVLLTEEGYKAATTAYNNGDPTQKPGCGWGYVPITMHGFTEYKAPYITEYGGDSAVTAPNAGKLYCNYRVISATVVVKNSSNEVVYEHTGYQNVGATGNIYRSDGLTVNLAALFPQATSNCISGRDYTFTVTLHLSNGTSLTFVRKATNSSELPYTHLGEAPALTYEEYMALSSAEKQEYFLSFDNVDDFYTWLEEAKAAYDEAHPDEVGDGDIDIGDYIN